MFNTEEEKRKLALSITLYAYRNTKLEDYHSENVRMNAEFYKKIYGIVSSKLKNVKLLHKYVENYSGKLESKDDLNTFLNTVPEELHFKFLRYMPDIIWGMTCGTNWSPAELVTPPKARQSLANYVLAGEFSECCGNGEYLDDKTMCKVNKDVHNRVYTLLIKGYFS